MPLSVVQRAQPWRDLSDHTDDELGGLFASAVETHMPSGRIALLAVGGYGRRELAPFSDLDILLLYSGKRINPEFVRSLLYPLWDSGRKVGHAVRTTREALSMVREDLDAATAMVSARVVAGDVEFGERVIKKAHALLRRRGREWSAQIHASVLARHRMAGEVAYLLEPDLKDGLGGLRDIHAMWWAEVAGFQVSEGDRRDLVECNDTLLRIRVALHQSTGRVGDVLHLQDQTSVASLAGFQDDNHLMSTVATVGRRVMWITDRAWSRLDPPRKSRKSLPLAPAVSLTNGEIHLDENIDPATDPTLILRVATAAARREARIEAESLQHLGRFAKTWPSPWPAGARDELVAFLLEGERAIPVWEALEQHDLVSRLLPEWTAVRCKPQRNAFHRFTVDRHLWQAAANAAWLSHRVARPDLLVLGALFHDLGKGYSGDHTEQGLRLFDEIGPRMGLNDADTKVVKLLIEHHLLLPDVATRRDISDDATITFVADRVGDAQTLDLLDALTEADALATGPTAWGGWRQELIRTLVDRVSQYLAGENLDAATWRLFPDAATLAVMARGKRDVRASDETLTVVNPDQPRLFTSVAGVLAVHGLDVLSAEAHSDEQGMAASRFRVREAPRDSWSTVIRDIESTFDGHLDLDARLRERASTYSRRRRESALGPQPPEVQFDDTASSNATVIEIHAPDRIGLLHEVSKVFADERLDIRHARINTLGDNVVDTFYVRNSDGSLINDDERRQLLTSRILHVLV